MRFIIKSDKQVDSAYNRNKINIAIKVTKHHKCHV